MPFSNVHRVTPRFSKRNKSKILDKDFHYYLANFSELSDDSDMKEKADELLKKYDVSPESHDDLKSMQKDFGKFLNDANEHIDKSSPLYENTKEFLEKYYNKRINKPGMQPDQKRLRILQYLFYNNGATKTEIIQNCFASAKDIPLLDEPIRIEWLKLDTKDGKQKYFITENGKNIIQLFSQIKKEIPKNEHVFDFFEIPERDDKHEWLQWENYKYEDV